MMKKIYFPFLIALITISISANAQNNLYKALPDSFFSVMSKQGNDAAIDYIFKTNKYLRLKLANNIKIKNELNNVVKLLGKYYGAELIKIDELSKSYVKLYYLARYDRQPLLFIFTMYKPNDEWRIQQLQFSEKVAEMLNDNQTTKLKKEY
jgi:hypothetical protein